MKLVWPPAASSTSPNTSTEQREHQKSKHDHWVYKIGRSTERKYRHWKQRNCSLPSIGAFPVTNTESPNCVSAETLKVTVVNRPLVMIVNYKTRRSSVSRYIFHLQRKTEGAAHAAGIQRSIPTGLEAMAMEAR